MLLNKRLNFCNPPFLRSIFVNIIALVFTVILIMASPATYADDGGNYLYKPLPEFTLKIQPPDTTDLQFPFNRKSYYPLTDSPGDDSPLYGKKPSNVETVIEYDPATGTYQFSEKIGRSYYRLPNTMSQEEYFEYEMRRAKNDYWQLKSTGENIESEAGFIPEINIGGEGFDRVFGSNAINITPAGSAELIFGFNMSKIDNPTISERLRRTPSFTFEEKILMNVSGSIGDKMQLDVNYNTEATFDFENKTKLEYTGKEDEIIKKIEAGNVSLPLTGSLITGSQSLFGLKTEMQFGKLTMTTVFSQQRGESSVIEVQGGAQIQDFEVSSDNYDANKHYFLSEYFRNSYNEALENLPIINSGVNITRIEVWITNKTNNFEESRNMVAFTDLGEPTPYNSAFQPVPSEGGNWPRNEKNNLYEQMTTGAYSGARNINNVTSVLADFNLGKDYEKIGNARRLNPREYDLNQKLGYISLNSALSSDEVLAVAYEYTYNGRTYRVGELSSSAGVNAPDALYLKLIKGTNFTPAAPTWDLMMKNVYAIGAYQVNEKDFTLDVLYQDDKTGNELNYIPEGDLNKKILLRLLNLDNLNSNNDPYPDGLFDYLRGITITPDNGRVFFPVLEPFGDYLEGIIRNNITEDVESVVDQYVFDALYDSTKTKAQQLAEKSKFKLAGFYQSSSSSEIMLNAMNVPQGSVNVTAGGRRLTEGVDFTVDYTLGRVTIINQGIMESGTPVKISLESNSLFNIQTKTLIGSHFDYKISDDFNIGATIMNLTERPLTQKVSIGDEPISNTIWGLNTSYRTRSQFLTSLVDKIPLIETKEPSTVTLVGEFAHLIPGHSRAIEKDGNAYIDDFEGSETTIDLKSFAAWSLASAPVGYFPEAELSNDLRYGFGRARIAWYIIDPLFTRNTSLTPGHLKNNPDLQSSHYVREVFEKDIFPEKETPNNFPTNISVLNVAYYPQERGPYNFDNINVSPDGSLLNPEDRWGGVMREIQSNDFEAANIEFIEFWLMDPYVEDHDNPGGDLFFNLGNISEDVLKDSRKAFENGLPATEVITQVDTTVWGRVPLVQSLVNAFNNEIEARQYQDVGLDGLSDDDERSFFKSFLDDMREILTPEAYAKLENDPANDNFHYYRGSDYDEQELGILARYKKYNGLENNSPTSEQSDESYPTTGSTIPNVEDINRDNTLSESESYYAYRVSLRPEDLAIGRNFIVDKQVDEVEFENGEKSNVTWYQFRVPVADYERTVGDIQDFKSIRFMRMFLTNFEDSTFLRFAKLHLVRGEWRKYNLSFTEGGEYWTGSEPSQGSFDISAVNIEENAGKEPVNYVLPPGITRVIDPTQPQIRQLNEQSIVLKVNELEDGDARAAYKNVRLDIRQYNKIEMETHAEAIEGSMLQDYELTAFIRLGSDYKNNFYEYEVPLKLTPPAPPGNYDNDEEADRLIVWPRENRFEIDLQVFQRAKQARNNAMRDPESEVEITTVFPFFDEKGNKVSISGNPNMANIRTIMIGVRNPKSGSNRQADDGMPKSGEIWLNELRLSEFNERGGWAANGRITTQLADFATVNFSGNTSTPGFGSIEKKVQERDQEQVLEYDVSGNVELGKFFPEKMGVSIPMYAGYSESIINPEYNPTDPDIPLKAALRNAETDTDRDSIKEISQDYARRKSLNFTNVRVVKQKGKPRIYDLANWSASYSFNEVFSRNVGTDFYTQRNIRGSLSYNFNTRPRNVTPFAKSEIFRSPYLRLLRDFNFYYMPSRLSFRTDLNRAYMEKKLRNLSNPLLEIDPTFKKDFLWNRYYDLKFDLTRSLKLDFSATNIARIDEPQGRMNKYEDEYQAKRDSILQEIYNFGRTINYTHQINATYNLPLNKIPFFNWINLSSRYNATYGWDVGPILEDPDIELGNTIRNSNTVQLNGQLNMTNLYNKVPYLKNLNQKQGGRQDEKDKRTREVTYERTNQMLRVEYPRSYTHKLKTEDIKVEVFDNEGQKVEADVEIIHENRVKITPERDVRGARVLITGTRELGQNPLIFIMENTFRILTGFKNINLTYSSSEGSMLPGYLPETDYLGTHRQNGAFAPGWDYILGFQDKNFPVTAFDKGWLSKDSLLNTPYMNNSSEKINVRATFEPFKGLRVDLTANRVKAENDSEFFIAEKDGSLPPQELRGRTRTGNFSMSYLSWPTAFERIYSKDLDFSSGSFDKFKNEYRLKLSERLAREYMRDNPGANLEKTPSGYYQGFGPNSQQVLISSFMSAYGGKEPDKVSTDFFPSLLDMMPNWRISFDGLSRIEFVKRYLNSLTINHAYRSSYNIGSFISNPPDEQFIFDPTTGNFQPLLDASSVSINEQFSPLFDLNMDWKNSLTSRVEFKRSRTLALSTANSQINEISSREIVIGGGYRFNEVPLVINGREYRSDLNVRADLSIRDNRTVIRKLTEDTDQITAGQRIISIKTTMDYVLSDRFNLRFFYDQRINNPFVSLSYPTSNTNIGFSVRFTLTN